MDADDIHNEIRAVGKLCKRRHRNIVEVVSICKDVWKTIPAYFIQMELCDGDMDSYIQRRYELGEPIGALEVVDTMVQILDGLVFLHENDEVHRDLKPKNGTYKTPV
jgi:serine/threonine protein kinase